MSDVAVDAQNTNFSQTTTPELKTGDVEHIPEDVFLNLLNGVANHEGKLLTTAVIATHPNRWFTARNLHSELLAIQGDEVGWRMSERLPATYCDYSLGPIGAVVVGKIEGQRGPVDAYKASPIGTEYGLAFAGALLGWSLTHPEISLQTLLGSTMTRSASLVRSPEVRWKIFSDLLTSQQSEISYGDIHKSIGVENYPLGNIGNNLRELEGLHIVKITSRLDEFNPIFEMDGSEFYHTVKTLEETSPANQAIYKTMGHLVASGKSEASLHEILTVCHDLLPDIDMQPIYFKLVKAAADSYTGIPHLKVTDRNGAPIERTDVSLEPAVVDAITDLCERLEQLRDVSNLPRFRQVAKDILRNPTDCSTILDKAKSFSRNYAGSSEGAEATEQRFISIIKNLGSLSAAEIQRELKKNGRPLSKPRVSVILRDLVTSGRLEVHQVRKDPTKKRKVNKFSVIEP